MSTAHPQAAPITGNGAGIPGNAGPGTTPGEGGVGTAAPRPQPGQSTRPLKNSPTGSHGLAPPPEAHNSAASAAHSPPPLPELPSSASPPQPSASPFISTAELAAIITAAQGAPPAPSAPEPDKFKPEDYLTIDPGPIQQGSPQMPRALQRLLDGLPPEPSLAMLSREELLRISDQEVAAQAPTVATADTSPEAPKAAAPFPPLESATMVARTASPEWPDVIGAGQGLPPEAPQTLQELAKLVEPPRPSAIFHEKATEILPSIADELGQLVPDLATSPSSRLREAEGRLARAARAYQKVRPHLTLQEPAMAVPFHIRDTVLGWSAHILPAPEALEKPGVGWDDPEEVVPIEVTRTFVNSRFVQVQAKKRRGEYYLWLKATDFKPRVGDKLSGLPNPDETIGGYILFGDYNRRGERLG